MTRSSALALVLLAAGLLPVMDPGALQAQRVDDLLLPRFGVRIESIPSVVHWDHRFEGGRKVPLGAELTGTLLGVSTLPAASGSTVPLPHLEALTRELEGGEGGVRLGMLRAVRSTTVVTVPLSVEAGITSFLTLGMTVPFVRRRIESDLAFSPERANVGFNPALDDPLGVDGFLSRMGAALQQAGGVVDGLCAEAPGSAECLQGQGHVAQGDELLRRLGLLYGAPLMALPGTPAGNLLQGRLAQLVLGLEALGIPLESDLPLAAQPLDAEGLELLLGSSSLGGGLEGLTTVQRQWELGDVDLHATVGLLDRVAADTAGDFRARLQVVAGVGVRFPTGAAPADTTPLDPGTGGGTTDISGFVTADLARTRWGVRGGLRYTVRGQVDEVRRIAPPDQPLAGIALRREVTREAGNQVEMEVAPRLALAPGFGIGGSWRMVHRESDAFRLAPGAPPGGEGLDPLLPDVNVLSSGTGGGVHFGGVTFSYTTVDAVREGRYGGWPFDVLITAERAFASTGGIRAPVETRFRGGVRLYLGGP